MAGFNIYHLTPISHDDGVFQPLANDVRHVFQPLTKEICYVSQPLTNDILNVTTTANDQATVFFSQLQCLFYPPTLINTLTTMSG